jgi:hypothetical protein
LVSSGDIASVEIRVGFQDFASEAAGARHLGKERPVSGSSIGKRKSFVL